MNEKELEMKGIKVNVRVCKLDERKATVILEVQNFEDVKKCFAELLKDKIEEGIVEVRDDEIVYKLDDHTVSPILRKTEEFLGETWFDFRIIAPLLRIYLLKTYGFEALLNYIVGGRSSYIKCLSDEKDRSDVLKYRGRYFRKAWAYLRNMNAEDIILWVQDTFYKIIEFIDSVEDEYIPNCAEDEVIIL